MNLIDRLNSGNFYTIKHYLSFFYFLSKTYWTYIWGLLCGNKVELVFFAVLHEIRKQSSDAEVCSKNGIKLNKKTKKETNERQILWSLYILLFHPIPGPSAVCKFYIAPETFEARCPCRESLVSWCTNTSRSVDLCTAPQISKAYSTNLASHKGWRHHGILVISVSDTICVDFKMFITERIDTSHGKLCGVAFQRKTNGTTSRCQWYCRWIFGS